MKMEAYERRDEVLAGMGFSSYEKYRESDLWKKIRRRALDEKGTQCVRCGDSTHLVHHVSYSSAVLSGEDLSGLIPVCHRCHKRIEFDKSGKKRSLEEANLALGYEPPKPKKEIRPKKVHKVHNKHVGEPHFVSRYGNEITEVGQPCRVCGVPVVKMTPKTKHKRRQRYDYHWYLESPGCKAMYMVESAKYVIDHAQERQVSKSLRVGPAWCPICGNHKKKKMPLCGPCMKNRKGSIR